MILCFSKRVKKKCLVNWSLGRTYVLHRRRIQKKVQKERKKDTTIYTSFLGYVIFNEKLHNFQKIVPDVQEGLRLDSYLTRITC